MLGISAGELAKAATIGLATVRRAEAVEGVPTVTPNNLAAIQRALEAAGVEFIDRGVRLRDDAVTGAATDDDKEGQ